MLHRLYKNLTPLSIGVLLLFPVAHLSADTLNTNFIQQRALDPIKLQTGLPAAASRFSLTQELQLSVVHNNVFMGGRTVNELLVIDGESSQVNLRYRRKLNNCWQLNFSGAWLAHSGGWFDNPVNQWHQLFGLPDAERGDWPANQLEYSYQNGNSVQLLTTPSYGVGDVQLQVQHYLGCDGFAPVLRAGVKLPIASVDHFFGSGSVDAFVDVQSTWRKIRPESRVSFAGTIGVMKQGKNEFIAEYESVVGFGVAGLNVSITPKLQLLAQFDWHTPMFHSELAELGRTAGQLSLGLRYQTHAKGAWEISFSEDAVIDTAPDIVARIAWVSRFDALLSLK